MNPSTQNDYIPHSSHETPTLLTSNHDRQPFKDNYAGWGGKKTINQQYQNSTANAAFQYDFQGPDRNTTVSNNASQASSSRNHNNHQEEPKCVCGPEISQFPHVIDWWEHEEKCIFFKRGKAGHDASMRGQIGSRR
jgi:hypothetical protein